MGITLAALVGRLGTVPLAGVGCGTVVLVMCAVLFNFLLFVTTPAVARAVAQQNINEVSPSCKMIITSEHLAFVFQLLSLLYCSACLASRGGIAAPARLQMDSATELPTLPILTIWWDSCRLLESLQEDFSWPSCSVVLQEL